MGRNILRAPGSRITDFGLHKDFMFMETRSLQFRWEMFNLANTTHLGFPNRDVSGGSGGSITTLGTDARIMQFALRLKFCASPGYGFGTALAAFCQPRSV